MINFDLIQAGIIVGSAPLHEDDVSELKRLKVTAVICLQSDQDLLERNIEWPEMLAFYRACEIEVYRYPILDFDEIDLGDKVAEPIRKLNELRLTKEKVYLNCNSGICRAPAVVLGYLCHYEGMTIEAGLRQISIARPLASPFRGAVQNAVAELKMSEATD